VLIATTRSPGLKFVMSVGGLWIEMIAQGVRHRWGEVHFKSRFYATAFGSSFHAAATAMPPSLQTT
jgi:hypothetical protein